VRREPLFINYLNGQMTALDVVDSFVAETTHEPSKAIAQKIKEHLPDLSAFKNDFKGCLLDLIDNGINQRFINYVNSYMKPSLEEILQSSGGGRTGESQYIIIKAEDTPWIEAMVCYNLCLFIKAYGFKEIKQCATCRKFFSYKGKYAKYCSDACKGLKHE